MKVLRIFFVFLFVLVAGVGKARAQDLSNVPCTPDAVQKAFWDAVVYPSLHESVITAALGDEGILKIHVLLKKGERTHEIRGYVTCEGASAPISGLVDFVKIIALEMARQ